jgi:hypothetical protein
MSDSSCSSAELASEALEDIPLFAADQCADDVETAAPRPRPHLESSTDPLHNNFILNTYHPTVLRLSDVRSAPTGHNSIHQILSRRRNLVLQPSKTNAILVLCYTRQWEAESNPARAARFFDIAARRALQKQKLKNDGPVNPRKHKKHKTRSQHGAQRY